MSLDPTKLSAKFAAKSAKWNLVDALYGGSQTMREAGERYLPKNPKEGQPDYIARLNRSTLFNAYKRSIQHAVARAFAKDITLEGYPGEIAIFQNDVDAQNRDITQFAKAVFTDALNRGVSYILVDFPYRDEQPLTLADAIASGDRPYWVPIAATQVLAAHSTLDGGSERLTHFRFMEYVTEASADGLDEASVQQVKAFNQTLNTDPVTFVVYRKQDGHWYVHSDGVVDGMPQIPVVADYTNRTEFYCGSPALYDLAETNVAHWQSSSEQRNILHVARVPFLHIKGLQNSLDPETGKSMEQEISIHSVLTGAEDAKWVETNGNALAAGAADLADLESKMEALGLMLTTPRSGNATATEHSINAAEANSILKDYALGLADCLEQCVYLTGLYLGLGNINGKVVFDTSFAVDTPEPVQPQTPEPTIKTP